MGYDEPSSKRSATVAAGAAAQVSSREPRLVLIAILLLGVGGYAAVRYDALDSVNLDSVTSLFGGAQPRARTAATPPVRVAQADVKDVPVVVHTIGTVLANSVVTVKPQID